MPTFRVVCRRMDEELDSLTHNLAMVSSGVVILKKRYFDDALFSFNYVTCGRKFSKKKSSSLKKKPFEKTLFVQIEYLGYI